MDLTGFQTSCRYAQVLRLYWCTSTQQMVATPRSPGGCRRWPGHDWSAAAREAAH